MLRRLSLRLLSSLVVGALLVVSAGSTEAATTPAGCGVRSPAAFADGRGRNSIRFQKSVATGDRLTWNTDDNRTLTPTTVRIRFAGRSFQVMGRGKDFTIAGQGNLQGGNFAGSLVERKVVREADVSGRVKTHTQRTIRTIVAPGGRTQWVICPGMKR